MTAGELSEKRILEALSQVMDPELSRDLVSLGMIENVKVQGGAVSFTLVLTTPACPLRRKLEEDCRRAVGALPGVEKVEVDVTSRVKGHYAGKGRVNLVPTARNTVAVASGKGGVGKSTVSVNLAVALAQSGAAVGLLDCDIYGPSIPLMMGVRDRPEVRDGKLEPLEGYGVKLMSIGFLLERDTPVIWRGPLVMKAVQQLLQDVAWGELDYLVIDLPPGTGDAQLTVSQSVPLTGAVVVSTPQDVALVDAAKAVAMFEKVGVPTLGIVENMSYFLCPHCGHRTDILGHGGANRESRRLGVRFLGEVPMDPEIARSGDSGVPAVVADPGSPAAKALREIASAVAARISVNYHRQESPEKTD
jgi:ATP-binding protein involved in chromosome partitioning